MRTTMLKMVGGGLITTGLLGLGALAGYAYAHWHAESETSVERAMDKLTVACLQKGGFSYKGYGYHCSLDEEGKRDLAEADGGAVEI